MPFPLCQTDSSVIVMKVARCRPCLVCVWRHLEHVAVLVGNSRRREKGCHPAEWMPQDPIRYTVWVWDLAEFEAFYVAP
jgi:hypothetical protein